MSQLIKLRDQLTQLSQLSGALAECLEHAADRLEDSGLPPDQQLLDELAGYRLQLEDIALSLSAGEDVTELSVSQLQSELAGQLGYSKAYEVLDQLLSLTAIGKDTGLEAIQADANSFRNQIVSNEFEQTVFDQLLSGNHAWCSLIRLVRDESSLKDAEWDLLSEHVREELGGTLATATIRGKIQVPPPNRDTLLVVSEPVTNAEVLTFTKELEVRKSTEPTQHFSTDNIFDEVVHGDDVMAPQDRSMVDELDEVVVGEAHSVINSALFEDEEPDDVRTDFELSNHQHFVEADGTLGDAARDAIRGDRFVRGEKLSKVILQLLLEGRSGLAYHLSRSMEASGYPFTRSFPSWMIHAWTLGHAVIFQRGQLASLLANDFAKAELTAGDGQLKLAQDLFARAVTLRPSIVTPSTGAPAILRSFSMDSDTTQIFNYCSRIGKYSEQIQGLLPGLFRTESSDGDRAERLSQLPRDVLHWKEELTDRSFRYETAKPLFLHANWTLRAGTAQRYPAELHELQQWQSTVQRAHRITGPILADNRDEAQVVRTELERLSTTLLDAGNDSRQANTLPAEEMRTYLRRAMSFGHRWLALLNPIASGEGFISQAAMELKTEIEERHAAVVDEVQHLMAKQNCFEVDIAGACFLLAMDQVLELFSSEARVSDQEPDPRHLLHAEFLKMPAIRLSSQWEPLCEMPVLEDSILEFLSRPQPDWLTAFQLQVNYGNTESAEKIVGLGTCSSQERTQLQALLNQHVKSQRDHLWSDLEETEANINEAVRLEILSEQDRTGFAARVEKLRRGLKTGHEFSVEAQEIEELREQLNKRRKRETNRLRGKVNQKSSEPPEEPQGWVMDFSGA